MTSCVKESSLLDAREQIDSPPAYEEAANARSLHSSQADYPPRFPIQWSLHGKKANYINIKTWHYTINSEDNQPLFAASISRLHMTIHAGPSPGSAQIAQASISSRESTNCNLKLLDNTTDGRPSYSVVMCSHNFTLPITRTDGTSVLETFEWRRVSGQEISAIDPDAYGWKLVRLEPEGDQGPGEEVVAAWAVPAGTSLTHVATIRYLGSGASGVLGDDWAVFAALSVLRVYQAETIGSVV